MKISPQQIKDILKEKRGELSAIRRHIHANPELSFKEYNTSAYITKVLENLGIEFQNGIVETGIVGKIEGKNPQSKVIALRADMDALPILEANDVSYKSVNEGVMHACGHDVHTTCLLGAAMVLNNLKDKFEGTIKLIFQPGEEKLPGGASLMIKEGVLKNPEPQFIFGQHVFPELEVGKVGFRSGQYMASADEIFVTVKGKGGHAALPDKTVDPILIASHIIVSLQQVVSRMAPTLIPTVLSFGKISGEGATNVIPNEVKLEGTFRTFNEEWRARAHKKIEKLIKEMTASMGGEAVVEIKKGYPFLVNDEVLTNSSIEAAREFLGEDNVVDLDMRMTAEDFAYYTHEMPATFYRLGTGNSKKGISSNIHTDTFDVDEDSLEIGAGMMAWLTLNQLK